MTDFFLPPDIGIAAASPNLDANTSSFSSPTVGSTRTAERLGDRLRFQLNFTTVNDNASTARQRGRMIALLMSLRGQSGRVWMTPPGATLRGSFPATEIITNNDFSNGVSNWSAGSEAALIALDRGMRVKRIANAGTGGNAYATQSVSGLTVDAPYALRIMVSKVNGVVNAGASVSGAIEPGVPDAGAIPAMRRASGIAIATSGAVFADNIGNLISRAGDYYDVGWTSLAQCALVDNGPNLLLNSDVITNATTGWSGTAVGSTQSNPSATIAPDGSATATNFSEDGTTGAHRISQNVTVAAAAADFSFSIFGNNANRVWCSLAVQENTGSTVAFVWFNISTGAVGTQTPGANVTILSSQVVNYGGGWKRLIINVRKTNAATSLTCIYFAASANGTVSYTGGSFVATVIWRAQLAQSSVAVAPVSTTSAAQPGTLQTGILLNLKGLPASSQGLLLPGDFLECNSQLNQVAANLDSDAAGIGTAILVRPPRNSPADNTPFIVNTPMGKFMVSSNSTGWNEGPGRISDASLELIEDISF